MHRRQHAAVHMQNGIVECKYAVLSTLATPEYARFPNIGHSLIEVKIRKRVNIWIVLTGCVRVSLCYLCAL